MCTHFTKQFYIIQIQQPVCIVYHQGFSFREINKFTHLFFKTVTVVLNLLRCHHRTHIRSSGRISDVSCTASDQRDRFISCHLQTFHQTKRHKVPYMKTICCWIKSNIKCCLSFIYQFGDSLLVCHLRDQTSCFQFVINLHLLHPHFPKI